MAIITTDELKLLIETVFTENLKNNHPFFMKIFDEFFNSLSDTYKLGIDSHLLLETDNELWDPQYSGLTNVDLSEIKRELMKMYLHDYNTFFESLETDKDVITYIDKLQTKLGIDRKFEVTELLKVINEEEFLIHKKFSQQKTLPIMFKYIEDLVNKTRVGQYSDNETYFKMYEGTQANSRRAFAYSMHTSLFKPIYDAAIKPITHPMGFSYNYYKTDTIEHLEYFNLETEVTDFKVYELDNLMTPVLLDNDRSIAYNPCSSSISGNIKVPQVKVSDINNISNYGGAKINLAGVTYFRTSNNEYKMVSDGYEQFEGEIHNCELLDWNVDTSSYTTHLEEVDDQDIRKDLYGAIVSYYSKELTFLNPESYSNPLQFQYYEELGNTVGLIISNGEQVMDAFYDIVKSQIWILVTNDLGVQEWKRSSYLGMNRDFVTFKSTESMYSLEALKFNKVDSRVRIYSVDSDRVFNPYGGSLSFFYTALTLEDDEIHYIVHADKEMSSTITHYVSISNKMIYIKEKDGVNSYAHFDFEPNRRYHIVFNWTQQGRKIFIDTREMYTQDDNKNYNEKFYIEGEDITLYDKEELLTIDLEIPVFSVAYDNIYRDIKKISIDVKVNYKKGGTVLFETTKETIQSVYAYIYDKIEIIKSQISAVEIQLQTVKQVSLSTIYVTSETTRIGSMLSEVEDLLNHIWEFDVKFRDVIVSFKNIVVENDQRVLKDYFDNIIDGTDTPYLIEGSTASFAYNTETNEMFLGNPVYFEEQKLTNVNYILDNFDILNRPLQLNEIIEINKDHDTYVKSTEFYDSGAVLYFSLDRKIFEHYHNEMESVDHCFIPWYLGETYDIGSDNNLLLQYYNDMENCSLIFDTDDWNFGSYIEHDKMKVDESLEFNQSTVVYDSELVLGVIEGVEDGSKKLIVHFKDGTRIDYVYNKYWRKYNSITGELLKERTEKIVMDYSYQIKIVGTKAFDNYDDVFILDSVLGDEKVSNEQFTLIKKSFSPTRRVRDYYSFSNNDGYFTPLDYDTMETTLDENGDLVSTLISDKIFLKPEEWWDKPISHYDMSNMRFDEYFDIFVKIDFGDYMYKDDLDLLLSDSDESIISDDGTLIYTAMDDGGYFRCIINNDEVRAVSIDNNVVWEKYYDIPSSFYNSTPGVDPYMDQTFTQEVYDTNNVLIDTVQVSIRY